MKNLRGLLIIIIMLSGVSLSQATLISSQAAKNQMIATIAVYRGVLGGLDRTVYKNLVVGASLGIIGNKDLYISQDRFGKFANGDSFGEAHLLFRFISESEEIPADMGVIVGYFFDKSGSHSQYGIALDLYLSPTITGRLNLVAGPRFGAEIGYLVNDNIELNITLGSAIAIFGIKIFNISPAKLHPKRSEY